MNAELRQLLRLTLLRLLDSASATGLPLSTLALGVQARGMLDIADAELRKELDYLEDKALIKRAAQAVSPELAPWRITADGRDTLAQ